MPKKQAQPSPRARRATQAASVSSAVFHGTLFDAPYPVQFEPRDASCAAEYRGVYTERWKPSWSRWDHPRRGDKHKGLDLYAPVGTALVSLVDGQVKFVSQSDSPDDLGNRAWLHFTHAGTSYRFIYGHMQRFAGVDRKVRRGEVIGYVGCSGNATQPVDVCNRPNGAGMISSHCHLALRDDSNNKVLDPLSLLAWKIRYDRDERDIPCGDLKSSLSTSGQDYSLRTVYARQRALMEQVALSAQFVNDARMAHWRDHLLDMVEAGRWLIDYPDNVDTAAPGKRRIEQFWRTLDTVVEVTDADRPPGTRDNLKRFLLHVAWHEGDRLLQRTQYQGGPARSFFQMEAPRAKDAVAYAAQKKFLDEAALAAKHPLEDITAAAAQIQAGKAHFPQGNLLGELLGIADTFAVWLVRSEFMRIAEAIPASNVGHADYWYRHWKRSGGDPEALKRRFALAADEADRLLSLHGLGLSEPNRDPSTELAYRERALLVSPEKKQANRRVGGLTASAAASPSADVALVPSTRAVELIVEHESGGYDYYLRILRERAHWPGGLSGVTIGFGFDLGYQSRGDLELAWGAELAAADLRRIGEVLGLKAKENDQASVRLLRDATARLADIAIPWDAAVRVFNAHTVPVEVQRTANALENAIMLPPDCFGALVSLVFNRGASFGKSGPRYQEMRAIAAHMRAREFARIPQELRSMKRLWDPVQLGGLHRRREDEARLFERGLGV